MWRRWMLSLADAWQQQPVLVLSVALGTFGLIGPLIVKVEHPDRRRQQERLREALGTGSETSPRSI
ncbi:hypothetical protein CCYA_CCYA13G3479 [Cyanidiococcus yangmingshanensis]|nr:hypothetical protein CCYA_CCYA13G3479 [Cyanidiococcus yangmingshanensis]